MSTYPVEYISIAQCNIKDCNTQPRFVLSPNHEGYNIGEVLFYYLFWSWQPTHHDYLT